MTTENPAPITVDLDAVKKELDSLTDEQLKEQLLKLRVRQKKQQKKNYGSPKQKAYQLRQREKQKLMLAKARELGLLEAIDAQADDQAEEELAAERAADATEQE